MDCLNEIDDPRKPSNGTLHDFQEILVIAIAAMLSDCDTVEDIACWALAKEGWLRRFLVLKNGIPSEHLPAHLSPARSQVVRGRLSSLDQRRRRRLARHAGR